MLLGLMIFIIGVPAAAGFGPLAHLQWYGRGIFDSMDFLVSNVMLRVSGLLTALFVGWRWWRHETLTEAGLERRFGELWPWLVRLAPAQPAPRAR